METIESLRLQLEQAQADIEQGASLAEINQTLTDMLEVMQANKPAPQAAPQVNVTNEVQPAPVQVHNTVTVQRSGFTFKFDYDTRGILTGGSILPIPNKGA